MRGKKPSGGRWSSAFQGYDNHDNVRDPSGEYGNEGGGGGGGYDDNNDGYDGAGYVDNYHAPSGPGGAGGGYRSDPRARGGGAGSWNSNAHATTSAPFTRCPPDTVAYFEELANHLDSLTHQPRRNDDNDDNDDDDDDEADQPQMLLQNALEECKGRAVSVATDPQCSRAMERLMKNANAESAAQLIAAIVDESDHAGADVATHACGSRVLEAALNAIARNENPDTLSKDAINAIDKIVHTATQNAGTWLRSVPGSYLLRTLMRTVGVPSTSPSASASAPASASADGHSAAATLQPCHPSMLQHLANAVADLPLTFRRSVVISPHGSAAMQALIQSHGPNASSIAARLLAGPPKDEADAVTIAHADVRRWSNDKAASRFVECAIHALRSDDADTMLIAPDGAFPGQLEAMAKHASENFVVQALLATCAAPEAVEIASAEIVPIAASLLFRNGGKEVDTVGARIMRALVDCCGRSATKRREVLRAVVEAAAAAASSASKGKSGDESSQPQADADAAVRKLLGMMPNDRLPDRIPPAACALLASMLCYPPNIANRLMTTVAALPANTIVAMAKDNAGSALLECLLDPSRTPASTGTPEMRQPLPKALYRTISEAMSGGACVALAMSPSGSRVLEALYVTGKLPIQEQVVDAVSRARVQVGRAPHGRHMLKKLGVDAYVRSPEAWRKGLKAREAMAAALMQDGGGVDNGDTSAGEKPKKKRRKT